MAFTVETGASVEGANSYISLTDADTYFDEYSASHSEWDDATDATKQMALMVATRYIDRKYGDRWIGYRADEDQGLDWPRSYALDHDGYDYDDDAVPTQIEHAVCEVALYYLQNSYEIYPNLDTDGDIKKQTLKLGALDFSTEYTGAAPPSEMQDKVFTLLRELLQPVGFLKRG